MLQGMSEFRSLYSLRFADRHQVFRVGSGDEVTPTPGMKVATCQDPVGGHIYGTVYDPTIKATNQTTAYTLISKCQTLADSYATLKQTAPDTNSFFTVRRDLNDSVEWLNFLRGLYDLYGRNID
jgi:hypothetical protein